MTNEYSVWWWDCDGGQHEELRFVNVEQAVKACRRLAKGPSSLMGIVERIIMTDGDDYCVFEWVRGREIVFPPKADYKEDASLQ
jgi:hypothetical protein